MRSGGSILEHDPDLIKELLPVDWKVIRPKEGASLKSWDELFVPGKDYITSKGRSVPILYPTPDFPVRSLEAEEKSLGVHKSSMTKIEDPTANCDCFGYGILDKKGVIADEGRLEAILEDDFPLVEKPQAGNWLVGRDPATGLAEHMAKILAISDGKVSYVASKEGLPGGLYDCPFNIMEERYKGLRWEIRRKNSSNENDPEKETRETIG